MIVIIASKDVTANQQLAKNVLVTVSMPGVTFLRCKPTDCADRTARATRFHALHDVSRI